MIFSFVFAIQLVPSTVEALQDRAACKEVQHFMSMSRLHYKRWEDCLKGTKRMFCWILSTWTWTLACFNGWVTDVGRLWRPQDLMSLTASMWRKSCWKVTWMSAPSLFSYIRRKKNISKTYPFLHSLQQGFPTRTVWVVDQPCNEESQHLSQGDI